MSETYTRKQVKCVDVAPILTGGVVLAIALGAALISSLSKPAQNACRSRLSTASKKPLSLKSNTHIDEEGVILTSNIMSLPPAERVKVSTLLALESSGCIVERSESIQQKMHALQTASSESEAVKAQRFLHQEAKINQNALFEKGLTVACEKASIKAGFSHIDTKKSPDGKTIRVIATDAGGRALVTELSAQNGHNRQIVSELIGVRDGSCKMIMNRFDQALNEQGVQSLPPERKFTGGVCESNAALAFLKQSVKHICNESTSKQENGSNQYQRLRKLNQKTIIQNK